MSMERGLSGRTAIVIGGGAGLGLGDGGAILGRLRVDGERFRHRRRGGRGRAERAVTRPRR